VVMRWVLAGCRRSGCARYGDEIRDVYLPTGLVAMVGHLLRRIQRVCRQSMARFFELE
jgi:hypothetical protein